MTDDSKPPPASVHSLKWISPDVYRDSIARRTLRPPRYLLRPDGKVFEYHSNAYQGDRERPIEAAEVNSILYGTNAGGFLVSREHAPESRSIAAEPLAPLKSIRRRLRLI